MKRGVVGTFFWWQEGQNHRPLQENASKPNFSVGKSFLPA
jgi:hypothetical protein